MNEHPQTPADPPGLLNSREAARYLSVSERTLQRLRDGGLPCVRLAAKTIRYRRETLAAWAAAQEQTATEGGGDHG